MSKHTKQNKEHSTGCAKCGNKKAYFYQFFGKKLCNKHFTKQIRKYALKIGLPILIIAFAIYSFSGSNTEPQKAEFAWEVKTDKTISINK